MLVEYLSSPTRARRVPVLLNVLLPLKHKERNWFFFQSFQSLVELPDAVGLSHSTFSLNMLTRIFAILGRKGGK